MEKDADLKPIPGNYQERALVSKSHFQRGWHQGRLALFQSQFKFTGKESIADIGCGSGIMINAIKDEVGSAYGIDSNPSAIEFCNLKFAHEKKLKFKLGQLDKTGLDRESLDFVLCTEVLEHVFDGQIDKILLHWLEILKPGGEIFLTTPNERSPWPLMEWILDKLKLVPQMAGEQHVSHWTTSKLDKTLTRNGFQTLHAGTFNLLAPMGFAFSENLGRALLGLERKLLKAGGPLLWIHAKKL